MDGHSSHYTPELLKYARDNNIIILGYLPHCTHALQGLDVVCFARMKEAWKEEIRKFEDLHRSKVMKGDFTEVFGNAFLKAFTVPTVLAAFQKTGIHPYNPDVITPRMMKASEPSSLIGSLLMGMLNNGLILMGFEPSDQMIARGLIILIAVALTLREPDR